jgi:hypothetical protein
MAAPLGLRHFGQARAPIRLTSQAGNHWPLSK